MIKRFLKSVTYAFQGFVLGVKEERNLRIDLVAMAFITRLALFYSFDSTQWAVLVVVMFIIPSLELMNTAVERSVAKPDDLHDRYAGQAKDTAAAGVFMMAAGAVAAGFLLFWDTAVFGDILEYYTANFTRPAVLAVCILAGYLFIVKDKFERKK